MSGYGRWWFRLAGAVLAFAGIEAAVLLVHGRADELRLALVVALVVCASALLVDSTPVEPAVWAAHAEPEGGLGRLDPRTASYLRILESHLSAREADAALRERLRELTDQTLRARHDLDTRRPTGRRAARSRARAGAHRPAVPPGPRADRALRAQDRGAVTTTPDVPTIEEAGAVAARVLDEVGKAIVGKQEALRLVLCAILAKGHVLLEDYPGLGKTLAARSFAQALGLDFARAQFTPDLLPSDLTGSFLYNQRTAEFEFRRGPIFTGLLLADEINRTPPKTQSALLEAMQERQVTVEGETFLLPAPFHVLATANPIEYEGTYPLPEAQLDRFLLRVSFGYPSAGEEYDVIARRVERQQEEIQLDAVTDAAGLLGLQAAVETVRVDDSVGRYCVALAAATREHRDALTGASPRGSLGLVLTARAFAALRGRDYIIPEDVKAVARAVLSHRVTVRPELWMTQTSGRSIVDSVLVQVPTPSTLETR